MATIGRGKVPWIIDGTSSHIATGTGPTFPTSVWDDRTMKEAQEDNGFLIPDCKCPGHHSVSCEHAWWTMKSNLDGRQGIASGRVYVQLFKDPVEGAVPFFPVWLGEEEKYDMRSIDVLLALGEKARIGFLGRGEGRRAIRTIYLEYLYSMYRTAPECDNSPYHVYYLFGPKERKNLDLDATSKSVLAGISSILTQGACWKCINPVVSGESDLIPDL